MGRFSENTRWYKAEIVFLTNEDKIRTEEEINELLEEIFNTNNYKFWGATVIDNECKHEKWERGQISTIDPDGWYYGQPCHSVEYICSKCGMKKYEEE